MQAVEYVAPSPGPAAFACAYLNGRADTVPPLLLALEGISDVAALLDVARNALLRGGVVNTEPTIVFTPDGVVVPKTARIGSQIEANMVLILSCGEPFDAHSVPERAKRMHMSMQRHRQRQAPLVRAEHRDTASTSPKMAAETEPRRTPWLFSPSGRWASPLALRDGPQHSSDA
jgi:hypothetical protein